MTCPWCEKPVRMRWATCSYLCYTSYWNALMEAAGARNGDRTIAMILDDNVPLDLEAQPWYNEHTTGEQ